MYVGERNEEMSHAKIQQKDILSLPLLRINAYIFYVFACVWLKHVVYQNDAETHIYD